MTDIRKFAQFGIKALAIVWTWFGWCMRPLKLPAWPAKTKFWIWAHSKLPFSKSLMENPGFPSCHQKSIKIGIWGWVSFESLKTRYQLWSISNSSRSRECSMNVRWSYGGYAGASESVLLELVIVLGWVWRISGLPFCATWFSPKYGILLTDTLFNGCKIFS